MLYPIIDPADVRARYDERLQEAKLRRRIERLELNNSGFFVRTTAFIAALFTEVTAETVPATTGNTVA